MCRRSRARETARIALGSATLGRSTPASDGLTVGRIPDALAVALIGTTANRSLVLPVISESIDMMIAGRFLPGSPGSLAPNRTSQTCPRNGSVDPVTDGAVPIVLLCPDFWDLLVCYAGCALRLDHLLTGVAPQKPR
jgi:hypothetical protein